MTNIAMVVLDTLRRDTFEDHFEWLPGVRFDNAWSPSHWTVPVHGSLFTGKYASEVGVYSGRQSLDCTEPVLAEQLREEGYSTFGLSCNINISDIYSFDRGFDELIKLGHQSEKKQHAHDEDLYDWAKFISDDSPDSVTDYLSGIKRCIDSDCATIASLYYGLNLKFNISSKIPILGSASDMGSRAVLNKIQQRKFGSKEFLFVNLMETHTPYIIPEEYRTVDDYSLPDNPIGKCDSELNLTPVQERYNNAARYLSDIYNGIFDELQKDFDIIITLSDHGELLGEHGFCRHGYGVFPEATHVPLSIWSGGKTIERDPRVVSLLDVHATVLEAAGSNHESPRGRDLLSPFEKQKPVMTEYHGILYPDRNLSELHDWARSETVFESYQQWKRGIAIPVDCYGYETQDSFQTDGKCDGSAPEERLEQVVDQLTVVRRDIEDERDISDSVEEELRHLGYL